MIGDMQPPAVTITDWQGRHVGHVPGRAVLAVQWGRESEETSSASVSLSGIADVAEDVWPWHHWMNVWDGDTRVWSGLVRTVTLGEGGVRLDARDVSTLLGRTRVPESGRFETMNMPRLGADVWERAMVGHRISTEPVVRYPSGSELYDYRVEADTAMVSDVFDDLVAMGLRWTVTAGRPVFGWPLSGAPVADLSQRDFTVALSRVRDGSRTYNDVRLQGQNYAATYHVDVGGLNLQSVVSVDDLFGVGNIRRAARSYVARTARVEDVIDVPSSAGLSPTAEADVEDLVPGNEVIVRAGGLQQLMRVSGVDVSWKSGAGTVSVRLSRVDREPEILEGDR